MSRGLRALGPAKPAEGAVLDAHCYPYNTWTLASAWGEEEKRREETRRRRDEKKKRRNMPVYLVISSNHPLSTHRVSKRVFLRLSVRVRVRVRSECRDVRGFRSDC